jgi:hypothetical protein
MLLDYIVEEECGSTVDVVSHCMCECLRVHAKRGIYVCGVVGWAAAEYVCKVSRPLSDHSFATAGTHPTLPVDCPTSCTHDWLSAQMN